MTFEGATRDTAKGAPTGKLLGEPCPKCHGSMVVKRDPKAGYYKSCLNCQSRLIHSTDVIGEYIGYIYDSLVRRGFIREDRLTGYEITKKGRERISEYLSKRALKA